MSIGINPHAISCLALLLVLVGCGRETAARPGASPAPQRVPAPAVLSWSPPATAVALVEEPPGAAAEDSLARSPAPSPSSAPAAAPSGPFAVYILTDTNWCVHCLRMEPALRIARHKLEAEGWTFAVNENPPTRVHFRIYDRIVPGSPGERQRQALGVEIPAVVAAADGRVIRAWDQKTPLTEDLLKALYFGRPHPGIREADHADQ